jgi:uncharacterized protein YaiE (UPF0345 family)
MAAETPPTPLRSRHVTPDLGLDLWRVHPASRRRAQALDDRRQYREAIQGQSQGGKITSTDTTGAIKMNNLIPSPKPSTELATSANAWAEYARSLISKPYVGKLLLFKKGEWTFGTGGEQIDIEPGTTAIAIVPSNQVGWQNFETGDCIFVPALQRLQLPTRRALGDCDPATWMLDESGKPKDPWQYARNMAMVLAGGVLCTFSSVSFGGKYPRKAGLAGICAGQ